MSQHRPADTYEPARIRKNIAKPFTVAKLAPLFVPFPPLITGLWLALSGVEILSSIAVALFSYGFFWYLTDKDPHIQNRVLVTLRRLLPFSFPPGMPVLRTLNRWCTDHAAHFIP